jgi:hypothetical protein
MSRQVSRTGPWTEEDVAYMRSRPTRFAAQLRQVDEGPTPDRPGPPENEPEGALVENNPEVNGRDDIEYVDGLNVSQIKDELRKKGLPTTGNRADLENRLLDALAADD